MIRRFDWRIDDMRTYALVLPWVPWRVVRYFNQFSCWVCGFHRQFVIIDRQTAAEWSKL